ncbi:MAG: hypothetical protein FWE32_03660 [Oscillospiraceae bacterium]|nr:hypothetical protein [Oscillospiraceae bacterium]
MKLAAKIMIAVCIFLLTGVTAYAETSVTIAEITPISGSETAADWGAEDVGNHAAVHIRDIPARHQPIDVETTTENGVAIIKKTFAATPELDPQTLIENFEQDGAHFTFREIQRMEAPGEISARTASKTAAIVSDTDDRAEVIQLFADTINYDQDGYSGWLRLDSTSLAIEAEDYETYTYPFTRTRDIPGLSRNDPALIEREWEGMTLSGLSFRQGADGRYTATAVYRGMTTGRQPVSFVATVDYYGEVTSTMPGNILYTIVYEQLTVDNGQLTVMESLRDDYFESPAQRTPPLSIILGAVLLIGVFAALPRIVKKLRKGKTQSHETINQTKRIIRED